MSRILDTPSPLHFPEHGIDAAFGSGVFVLEGTFASPVEPFQDGSCTGGCVTAFEGGHLLSTGTKASTDDRSSTNDRSSPGR